MSDEEFHNTGVAWLDGKLLDESRFAVTQDPKDEGAFKTPTLREVARTAPYIHDGSLRTLQEAIDFHSAGGRKNPNLDEEVRTLKLTKREKASLVAFLRSLSGAILEGL